VTLWRAAARGQSPFAAAYPFLCSPIYIPHVNGPIQWARGSCRASRLIRITHAHEHPHRCSTAFQTHILWYILVWTRIWGFPGTESRFAGEDIFQFLALVSEYAEAVTSPLKWLLKKRRCVHMYVHIITILDSCVYTHICIYICMTYHHTNMCMYICIYVCINLCM